MQDLIRKQGSLVKTISQHKLALAGALLLIVSGAATYGWMRVNFARQETPAPTAVVEIRTVTALGRLEPQSETIKLSAPTSNQGNRVDRLLVEEGDFVKAGQTIAILDSYDRNEAALKEAETQIKVARDKLDTVRAGAKQGEIDAQKAEIDRLTAERQGDIDAQIATVDRLRLELQNAQTEYSRYQFLYGEGAISASERDRRRLTLETAQKSVREAQATLDRLRSTTPKELTRARATLKQIEEVRPIDVQSAQTEIEVAIAARDRAKADLEQSLVRSPSDGEILNVITRAGEVVSTDGIVEIGQTKQMQAIAEVYQSDINKIRVGQRARITSDSIAGELIGKVERIGSQVRRQTIVNTDPSANIDARVIEVHVNLDDASSKKAAKFTNLQVQVMIDR